MYASVAANKINILPGGQDLELQKSGAQRALCISRQTCYSKAFCLATYSIVSLHSQLHVSAITGVTIADKQKGLCLSGFCSAASVGTPLHGVLPETAPSQDNGLFLSDLPQRPSSVISGSHFCCGEFPLPTLSGDIRSNNSAQVRYASVTRSRRLPMSRAWKAARQGPVPDGVQLPSTYFVYVLGSGGHTGELCEMIKQQFRLNPRSHRRYIVTSGDSHSINAVERLEGLISRTFPASADGGGGDSSSSPGGTWDIVHVVRARRVHQPLYTAWLSALLSALSIVQALVLPPKPAGSLRKGQRAAVFTYPNLIVTNGPGTGFIVCLVAFVLKVLFVIPADRCSILFIETWAHVSTLSLTGKLFYYSRIADMFVVQHEPLATKTGQRYIGDVTKYGNLLGIRKSLGRGKPKA